MGNCVRKESSTEWGGEDWGPSSPVRPLKMYGDDDVLQYGGDDDKDAFGKSAGREIKVKISKKQLEQLVGNAHLRGLSIDQLLAELMNGADESDHHHDHHRSWRPALQSIPEVN